MTKNKKALRDYKNGNIDREKFFDIVKKPVTCGGKPIKISIEKRLKINDGNVYVLLNGAQYMGVYYTFDGAFNESLKWGKSGKLFTIQEEQISN